VSAIHSISRSWLRRLERQADDGVGRGAPVCKDGRNEPQIGLWWMGRHSAPPAMSTHQQDGSVLEVEKAKVKPPPLYKVLLLNDDYTPMDFVVVVLQTVFAMSREKATQVMLQVHREGMGVCGTYTREVAAAKVDQVIDIARKHQHPLQCTMEEL
jgi:ATP-dependent Clp protease adaptor protein ClpS